MKRNIPDFKKFKNSLHENPELALPSGADFLKTFRSAGNSERLFPGLPAFLLFAVAIFPMCSPAIGGDSVDRWIYNAGISEASGLVHGGKLDAAREILIDLPKSERQWEWEMLMTVCGPPSWKVSARSGPDSPFHPVPEVSSAIGEALGELEKLDPENSQGNRNSRRASYHTFGKIGEAGRWIFSLIGRNLYAVLWDFGGTEGSNYHVVADDLEYEGEPALKGVHAAEGNFGTWSRAAFTRDGSLLLLRGDFWDSSPSSSISAPDKIPASPVNKDSATLATRVVSVPANLIAQSWKNEPDNLRRTWFQARRLADLTPEARQKILKHEIVERDGIKTVIRRFADYHRDSGGKIRILYNVLGEKDCSAEIRDLEGMDTVVRLGARGIPNTHPRNGDVFGTWDIGGAFNAEGTLVVVCPGGINDKGADEGPAAVYDSRGKWISALEGTSMKNSERWVDPVWGFRPDSRHVFQSSFRGDSMSNSIILCDVETGKKIPDLPEALRFCTWSPDSKILYTVGNKNSSMRVWDSDTFSALATIPDLVIPNAYPLFEELPVDFLNDNRYAIGPLVFDKNPERPLFRLGLPEETPRKPWLLRALNSSDAPESLNVAQLALWNWIQDHDSREMGTGH